MQSAETVLGILRERGRRGLPCDELYRQLFNPQLYLLAYGRIYSNKGAMTPGVSWETVDGMSMAKIESIIDLMRHERIAAHLQAPTSQLSYPRDQTRNRLHPNRIQNNTSLPNSASYHIATENRAHSDTLSSRHTSGATPRRRHG
jgi:hypothetical protein